MKVFRFLCICLVMCLLIAPDPGFCETEGTVPGVISMYLFRKDTGRVNAGQNVLFASIGDTISIDVYVRNLTQVPVAGIETYLTVDAEHFDFVTQGYVEEKEPAIFGLPKVFIKGSYLDTPQASGVVQTYGNRTAGDSLSHMDNGIPGWQLNYVELTGQDQGFGRPVSTKRNGVVCTFQLIAKAPGDSLSIAFDNDQYNGRVTQYYDPYNSDSFFFSGFHTCYIMVTGIIINPPLPDIVMRPASVDSTIDLDDHIEISSIPDSLFVWNATGNDKVSVDIDSLTHKVTFTSPANYRGFEDIIFNVGSDDNPDMAADTLRVIVGEPPVLNEDAIPDTLTIYEDSLTVLGYLPDMVTDLDDDFADLEWSYKSGGFLAWQEHDDSLYVMGANNFFGYDTLTMTVSDPFGATDSADVVIEVLSVNDAPKLKGIPDVEFERTKSDTVDVAQYASDVDDTNLELSVSESENLAIVIDGMKAGISEKTSFQGSEEVIFTVTDPAGLSASDTVIVTVTKLKIPPVWSKLPKVGFPQGGSFSGLSLWDYVNDPDSEDETISFEFSNYDDVDSIYVDPVDGNLSLYDLDNQPGWDFITVTAVDIDENRASTVLRAFVGPADGTPIVADIPDTTVRAGTISLWVDLDEYYYDVDNSDDQMTWTWAHTGDKEVVDMEIDAFHRVNLGSVHPDSTGIDHVRFTVTDPDSKHDGDDSVITVLGETRPILDMPPKIGFVNGNSAIINLDDYAEDPDFPDSLLSWVWNGNINVGIELDEPDSTHSRPASFSSEEGWIGWERVHFVVENPLGGSAIDSTLVFSVPDDGSPVAGGLHTVRVHAGYCDSMDIDLDDYFYDADTVERFMVWTASGGDSVSVTIDPATHKAKFCSPSQTFEGQEIIKLKVSDGVHADSMNVLVDVYGAVIRDVLSMLVFRNPMQGDYMDVYLSSDRELQMAPSLSVQIADDTTDVVLTAVADTVEYYHGSYLLPYNASIGLQNEAKLVAAGTTATGYAVEDSLKFTYGRLGVAGGKLAVGPVSLTVPAGALDDPVMLTLVEQDVVPGGAAKTASDEIMFFGKSYTLGPKDLDPAKSLEIESTVCCRADGAGIYVQTSGGWVFVGGLDDEHTVRGDITGGGTFRLGYDRTAPDVMAVNGDTAGHVTFTVTDGGSGVDTGSVQVTVDGAPVKSVYDADSGKYAAKLPDDIESAGVMQVEVTAVDRAGNAVRKTLALDADGLPQVFSVSQNVPNPFNPMTSITFMTPVEQRVTIEVYDILGRRLRTLVDTVYPAGTHRITWHAKDDQGRTVSSGAYLYRVKAGSKVITRKMLFIR